MELSLALRRFLAHVAMASSLLFLILLTVERLIPGFVTPFIDLPDVGLVVVGLVVAACASQIPTKGAGSRIVALVVSGGIAMCGLLFLWSQINDLGTSGVGLFVAALLGGGLFLFSIWSNKA